MPTLTTHIFPLRLVLTTALVAALSACGGAPISSSSATIDTSSVATSSLAAASSSVTASSSMMASSSSSLAPSSSAFSSSSLPSSAPASSSSASSVAIVSQLNIEATLGNFCAQAGAYEMEHMGYNGGGYYNGPNAAGAGFSLAIKAEMAGDYALEITFANGGTAPRSAKVNSGPNHPDKNIDFAQTTTWDNWQTSSVIVSLNQGSNLIAITSLNTEGLANIDSVNLIGSGLSLGQCPPTQPVKVPFIVGMDISSIPELRDFNVGFYDTDGTAKDMLSLLKNHGVNFIRLRTFINPLAPAGYASKDATCAGKAQAYNDQAHLVAFAKEVKQAGLGLLLDLHYSDTWTDPGKQIIPSAWRNITSLNAMATQVRNYTRDIVTALDNAGAKPEIVQVGNEITAGMLVHVPTTETTCWGDNVVVNNAVNGSATNWDNLATLLKAGINGVKDVDANIDIMLHIENAGDLGGMQWWVDNALQRNVSFDILGLSAYEPFQGPSSNWTSYLKSMASRYPQLKFAFAEYNQEITLVNTLLKQLPNNQGVGTFFWEPTQSGYWGEGIFDWNGNSATANAARFGEFDNFRQQHLSKPKAADPH